MANYIDEYVKITYQIGTVATLPPYHRKISTFLNFASGSTEIVLIATNINIKDNAFRANFTETSLAYLDTFFSQGGTEIECWNFAFAEAEFNTLNKQIIIPYFLDFASLAGFMNNLGTTLQDKYVHIHLSGADITAYKADPSVLPVTGRFLLINKLQEDVGYWYDILANIGDVAQYPVKFTQYYNNSLLPNLSSAVTVESLIADKVNGLLYYDSLSRKQYENIVDSSGIDFNFNLIREDIGYLVQLATMQALANSEIPYTQGGINLIGGVMLNSFASIRNRIPIKIRNSKVINPLYSNQTSVDEQAGIVKGYIIRYRVVYTIRSVEILIQERL